MLSNTFSSGFKRPFREKTHDRIFSPLKKENIIEEEKQERRIRRNVEAYRDCIGNMFEEHGKITRVPKITDKPGNSNFKVLAEEAKNNLSDRYYYENNKNQW